MLYGKNILFFGNSSDISHQILQKAINADANQVVFCPEEEVRSNNLPKVLYLPYSHKPDNLAVQLITLSERKIKFDGLVFAGGIGGVRPAKLNSESFVLQMFEKNVFAFLEIIRFLLKKRLINEGASILALSSVSSIKGLKSKYF